jgi:hypothetical protein
VARPTKFNLLFYILHTFDVFEWHVQPNLILVHQVKRDDGLLRASVGSMCSVFAGGSESECRSRDEDECVCVCARARAYCRWKLFIRSSNICLVPQCIMFQRVPRYTNLRMSKYTRQSLIRFLSRLTPLYNTVSTVPHIPLLSFRGSRIYFLFN